MTRKMKKKLSLVRKGVISAGVGAGLTLVNLAIYGLNVYQYGVHHLSHLILGILFGAVTVAHIITARRNYVLQKFYGG